MQGQMQGKTGILAISYIIAAPFTRFGAKHSVGRIECSVRPEPVEGPFMARQAHHEGLDLKLYRLKWLALFGSQYTLTYAFNIQILV